MLIPNEVIDPHSWNISPKKGWNFTERTWHIKWVPAQKSLHTNTYTGRSETCFSHMACCWDLALNGINLRKSSRLKDELRGAGVYTRRHFRLPVDNVTSPETHAPSNCMEGPARRGRCCCCEGCPLGLSSLRATKPRQPPGPARPTAYLHASSLSKKSMPDRSSVETSLELRSCSQQTGHTRSMLSESVLHEEIN